MAERVISLGNPLGLQIEIRWSERRSNRSAEKATYGKVALWIRENLIWVRHRETWRRDPRGMELGRIARVSLERLALSRL